MSQMRFDFENDACEQDRRVILQLWTVEEIYDDATTGELLSRFYEDERVERKPSGIHAESLATYVCMWANSPPDGGIITLGIEDDGKITGCTKHDQRLVEVERRIRSDLVPDARFSTKRIIVETHDGKPDFLILYRIKCRDDKVVETNKGEAYIRRNNSRHHLTDDEIRELKFERGQISFELESCSLSWPVDFDATAMRAWTQNVCKMKKIQTEPELHQTLVNHRLGKMVRGAFAPNNACALLFANNPQDVVAGCMLRFQRIEGGEAATGKDRNVVKDIQIVGTVPQIIMKAYGVIDSQLRTYRRLGNDGKFYTELEYPDEAWQEAVVNACVHRSYTMTGMNIFVRMFDDRIVVESPGGFPPFVTPENIYEVHYRRNWWLMDAMFYIEFVQCEGEGADRIRRAMKERGLPDPLFEQKQVGGAIVRLTLRNNHNVREKWVDSDVSDIIGDEVAKTLTDYEKRLINFVAEHGKINISQAMQLMPKPRWHTAQAKLIALTERGILDHVSRYQRDPTAYYALRQDGSSIQQPAAE